METELNDRLEVESYVRTAMAEVYDRLLDEFTIGAELENAFDNYTVVRNDTLEDFVFERVDEINENYAFVLYYSMPLVMNLSNEKMNEQVELAVRKWYDAEWPVTTQLPRSLRKPLDAAALLAQARAESDHPIEAQPLPPVNPQAQVMVVDGQPLRVVYGNRAEEDV